MVNAVDGWRHNFFSIFEDEKNESIRPDGRTEPRFVFPLIRCVSKVSVLVVGPGHYMTLLYFLFEVSQKHTWLGGIKIYGHRILPQKRWRDTACRLRQAGGSASPMRRLVVRGLGELIALPRLRRGGKRVVLRRNDLL